jgi:octaprenyl-diphosphate synthase
MSGERTDADFQRALALVRKHNAIGLTLEAARTHAAAAKQALLSLPSNAYSDALADLADFVVERGY